MLDVSLVPKFALKHPHYKGKLLVSLKLLVTTIHV